VKPSNAYVTVAGLRFHGQAVAEYATAGHLPILHYRRKTGAVERLSIEQFPVGMIPNAEYRASEVTYSSGDIFVLLTDGIVEVADSGDREFGLERVEQLLSENAANPLGEIADVITRAAAAHGVRTDDQTLLLARIAASQRASPATNV
jgi:serine phosphatase RsbU (regulator of sigma subunit)